MPTIPVGGCTLLSDFGASAYHTFFCSEHGQWKSAVCRLYHGIGPSHRRNLRSAVSVWLRGDLSGKSDCMAWSVVPAGGGLLYNDKETMRKLEHNCRTVSNVPACRWLMPERMEITIPRAVFTEKPLYFQFSYDIIQPLQKKHLCGCRRRCLPSGGFGDGFGGKKAQGRQTKKEKNNERYFNEAVIGSRCSFRTSDKKMES